MMNRLTTTRRRAVVAALGMCGLLLTADSMAQSPRWGRPPSPKHGACFYQDEDYEGDYFCVSAGEDLPNIPYGLNNEISSIRMFGDVEVRVYRDSRFGGRSETFDRSIRNLEREGWNDRLSSARIREGRNGGGNNGSERGNNSSASRQDPDKIVRRAYQDILQREPEAGGLRMYRSYIIDDHWTEAQVRDALRNSPEYRELHTMTQAKAEAIVARAYRSVLKRDPDPASRAYVDRVLRDKWTEEDVAAELRKSPEYRNKKP